MTRETIVRSAFRYRAASDLILEASAEGAYNSLDGQTSLSVNGVPQAVVGANAGVHELRGELFTQANWTPSQQWSLEAGARAEFSTIVARGVVPRSFAFLKPRVLISWSPWQGQQLRARIQRVVGQLDFTNFIATSSTLNGVSAGNSGLKPDHRWQIEGDYEWHFWDKGALLLTYLHEDIKDLVDFVPLGNGQDGPGNVPRAVNDQYGVEFNLPLEKLGLDGGQCAQ
jgi:outer membrane receptor protein involved in Fe transport